MLPDLNSIVSLVRGEETEGGVDSLRFAPCMDEAHVVFFLGLSVLLLHFLQPHPPSFVSHRY